MGVVDLAKRREAKNKNARAIMYTMSIELMWSRCLIEEMCQSTYRLTAVRGPSLRVRVERCAAHEQGQGLLGLECGVYKECGEG